MHNVSWPRRNVFSQKTFQSLKIVLIFFWMSYLKTGLKTVKISPKNLAHLCLKGVLKLRQLNFKLSEELKSYMHCSYLVPWVIRLVSWLHTPVVTWIVIAMKSWVQYYWSLYMHLKGNFIKRQILLQRLIKLRSSKCEQNYFIEQRQWSVFICD